MKILNQNVPPDIAAGYAEIVSTNALAPGGVATIRQRKAVRLLKRTKRVNRMLIACYEAVDALIAYRQGQPGWSMPSGFRTSQAHAIYAGVFDLQYWAQCEGVTLATLENVPAVEAFTGPRAYAYPDPNNQPSKAVYSNGTSTTGYPLHTGETISNVYRDTLLRWRRYVYTLNNTTHKNDGEPLLMQIAATITAAASYRPSRAMLSVVYKWYLVNSASTKLTTLEPPTSKVKTQYWRYKTPSGNPPFFNYTQNVQALFNLRAPKREAATVDLTKLVFLIANMPMMGKRYNNNLAVNTQLTAIDLKLWQIRKQAYATWSLTEASDPSTIGADGLTVTLTPGDFGLRYETDLKVNSGKWYWELQFSQVPDLFYLAINVGIYQHSTENAGQRSEWTKNGLNDKANYAGDVWDDQITYSSAISTGDVLGFALDMDAGTISVYKNGIDQGVMFDYMYWFVGGFDITKIQGLLSPFMELSNDHPTDNLVVIANFGQSGFSHTPPTGYNNGYYS